MRFIVSVELSIPVVERLVLLQEELNEPIEAAGGAVRWTAPEHLRVNLMVFPHLESGTVQRIQETLRSIAAHAQPFSMETMGTNVAKVPSTARLVTSTIEQGADLLAALRAELHDNAELIGFDQDPRPWRPLVLVGRLATPYGKSVDFDQLFAPYAQTPWGETVARELVLYRSEIVGKSERIRVVKRFALGTGI